MGATNSSLSEINGLSMSAGFFFPITKRCSKFLHDFHIRSRTNSPLIVARHFGDPKRLLLPPVRINAEAGIFFCILLIFDLN